MHDLQRATVVVVTFNHREVIPDCLDALRATLSPNDEAIVVDNASSDGTADVIADRYPWVRLQRSEVNRGFGAACNLGAAAAKNGWAGVVIDGCVRDVAELAQCAVGIKALAVMPLPTDKRNEGQRDVAVQVRGVWIRPGDWLVADEDGIVVLAEQPA